MNYGGQGGGAVNILDRWLRDLDSILRLSAKPGHFSVRDLLLLSLL